MLIRIFTITEGPLMLSVSVYILRRQLSFLKKIYRVSHEREPKWSLHRWDVRFLIVRQLSVACN